MKLRGSLISDIFFVFATLQASLFLNTATWIKHLAVGVACYRDSMRGNRKAAAMLMCACAFASALCLQRTFFVSAPVRRAPASREVFLRPALPEPEPTPGSILLLSKILAGLSGQKLGISMIRYGVLLFVFNNGIKEIQMTLIQSTYRNN